MIESTQMLTAALLALLSLCGLFACQHVLRSTQLRRQPERVRRDR